MSSINVKYQAPLPLPLSHTTLSQDLNINDMAISRSGTIKNMITATTKQTKKHRRVFSTKRLTFNQQTPIIDLHQLIPPKTPADPCLDDREDPFWCPNDQPNGKDNEVWLAEPRPNRTTKDVSCLMAGLSSCTNIMLQS